MDELMGLLLTSCFVQETWKFYHCIICFCSQRKYITLSGAVCPRCPGRREVAGIKSRTLLGQCRVLVLNSLLLSLSALAEIDQPGGFPLAAISHLLNTQEQGPASGCGRTLTDMCEDEEELNGGVGAGAAG